MTEQTEPRFQFSLTDVLAGFVCLAVPTLLVSNPSSIFKYHREQALMGVLVASIIGCVAGLIFRRAWNSGSAWFFPPFVMAGCFLVLLRYLDTRDDFGLIFPLFFSALLLLTAATFAYAHKLKYPAPWLWAGMTAFAVCVVGAIEIEPLSSSRNVILQKRAVKTIRELSTAQEQYIRVDHDGDGVLEYAQTLMEFREPKPGVPDLRLISTDILTADATNGPPKEPVAGYCVKVLKMQGANASGGAKSYLDTAGNMTGGFAFVLFPSEYGVTGRLTILLNHAGDAFYKNLGPSTQSIAETMTTFDPDTTWTKGWPGRR